MSRNSGANILPNSQLLSSKYPSREPASDRPKPRLVIDTQVLHTQTHTFQPLPVEQASAGSGLATPRNVGASRRKQKSKTGGIGHDYDQESGAHIRAGPHRTVRDESKSSRNVSLLQRFRSNAAALENSTPKLEQEQSPQRTLGLHKHIQRLRPSPLDLSRNVSPSDRLIPIGLALSSENLRYASHQSSQDKQPVQRMVVDATTPTIIITPAREAFTSSPDDIYATSNSQASPCGYSKYNTAMDQSNEKSSSSPTIPPMPFLSPSADVDEAKILRSLLIGKPLDFDSATNFSKKRRKRQLLPIRTVRETSDSKYQDTAHDSKRLTSQSLLPTPLRSKGWWNVLTSPFISTPKNSAPLTGQSQMEESDEDELLANVQRMGMANSFTTLVPSSKVEGDTSLRSAPLMDPSEVVSDDSNFQLKRSDTAPAALDPGSHAINIYSIPSEGEAAAYYNPNRNFPSLIIPFGSRWRDNLAGWSPSQSVFREPRDREIEGGLRTSSPVALEGEEQERAVDGLETNMGFPESAGEAMATDTDDAPPAALRQSEQDNPSQSRSVRTEALKSCFSPCTPSPVSEHPENADMSGIQSIFDADNDHGQAETVAANSKGLGLTTMASKVPRESLTHEATTEMTDYSLDSEEEEPPQGLGILSNEKAAPRSVLQFPDETKLGTDRFGQLRIETDELKSSKQPWYRRLFWFWAVDGALLLMLLVVLLVIYIPQRVDNGPVEAQWLNLTGFPPMPTGVMTIIQPTEVASVDGCVNPSSLWSCAMPPVDSTLPAAKLPNFRLEISFRNQTNSELNSTDLELQNQKRSSGGAVHASMMIRRSLWTNYIYSPSPAPPSTADQLFIGRTTDNNSEPYDGEETPFYISLLTVETLEPAGSATLARRDDSNWHWPLPSSLPSSSAQPSSASTSASTSQSTSTSTAASVSNSVSASAQNSAPTAAPTTVPTPILQSNGEPAPASLYPFASAQPLRLYDRGLPTEHYGFYTYFSRSLYISAGSLGTSSGVKTAPTGKSSNITISGSNNTITTNVALEDASAVCTWSQTRMLIQIWTRKPGPSSSTPRARINADTDAWDIPAGNSTANVMTAPGSFPYAISITSDRHGGDASEKGVYCYGLNDDHQVNQDVKTWIAEDRGFGGTLIRPAQVPGGSDAGQLINTRDNEDPASGVDGGTGGCACRWQNWS